MSFVTHLDTVGIARGKSLFGIRSMLVKKQGDAFTIRGVPGWKLDGAGFRRVFLPNEISL
jgi:hypothetical protein